MVVDNGTWWRASFSRRAMPTLWEVEGQAQKQQRQQPNSADKCSRTIDRGEEVKRQNQETNEKKTAQSATARRRYDAAAAPSLRSQLAGKEVGCSNSGGLCSLPTWQHHRGMFFTWQTRARARRDAKLQTWTIRMSPFAFHGPVARRLLIRLEAMALSPPAKRQPC